MFTVTTRGFRELDMTLRLIVARLRSDLPGVMREIASEAAETARERIGQERQGWAPLAASTIAAKQRHGWTGRISYTDPLLASGAMRASVHGEGAALVATVRASRPALFHEKGTERMPRRSFLRPAFRATYPLARRLLAETFETAIRER